MGIEVLKLTNETLMKRMISHVFSLDSKSKLSRWYKAEHSPIRSQIFAILGTDIPYSVCMQMRTHDKNGALFLIQSGRPDTGTASIHSRNAPRNIAIICNAQHLIDWSRKRLCCKAEKATRDFMFELKLKVSDIDLGLAECMMPNCQYRNGICVEFKPCGILNMEHK